MGWRADARAAIRAYPELCRRERELHDMPVTPHYSAEPGAGEATRTTENAALRQLPPDEQKALEAVRAAVRVTRGRYINGERRLRLIELIYWQRSHTLQGAAMAVHVSVNTARRWREDFEDLVDTFLRQF